MRHGNGVIDAGACWRQSASMSDNKRNKNLYTAKYTVLKKWYRFLAMAKYSYSTILLNESIVLCLLSFRKF